MAIPPGSLPHPMHAASEPPTGIVPTHHPRDQHTDDPHARVDPPVSIRTILDNDTVADYLPAQHHRDADNRILAETLGGGVSNTVPRVIHNNDCLVVKQPSRTSPADSMQARSRSGHSSDQNHSKNTTVSSKLAPTRTPVRNLHTPNNEQAPSTECRLRDDSRHVVRETTVDMASCEHVATG